MTQVLASVDIEDPLEAAHATGNPGPSAHRCSGLTDRNTVKKRPVGFRFAKTPRSQVAHWIRQCCDAPGILVHRENYSPDPSMVVN